MVKSCRCGPWFFTTKMLASTRGTSGGMMLFWSEGGERVTEGQENIVVLAVYRPRDDRQLQHNCSTIHRSLVRCHALSLLAFSLSPFLGLLSAARSSLRSWVLAVPACGLGGPLLLLFLVGVCSGVVVAHTT